MVKVKCRICSSTLKDVFLDLGHSPLANSYLKKTELKKKEKFLPLKVYSCSNCKLVQLPEHETPKKIFSNYDYLSSPSISWVNHAKKYVEFISKKYFFDDKKFKVCEIASNDGYLLQFFDKKKFDILGIEPAKNIAKISIKKKIPTLNRFFTTKLAREIKRKYGKFDLIIGNNVFAHVPNIRDFSKGIEILLSESGIVTLEFPHLLQLIKHKQFDTIYHEHFSYLSIKSINYLFKNLKLEIFKIEELKSHGGSLRLYIKKKKSKFYKIEKSVNQIIKKEKDNQIFKINTFNKFQNSINFTKEKLINFLIELKLKNKKVIAYGAPAKGNTFLNFCLIDKNLIEFTVDRAKTKVGKFLPGSQIPIYDIKKIKSYNPDYIIILPWNLENEIKTQIKKMNLKSNFITCIPKLKIST